MAPAPTRGRLASSATQSRQNVETVPAEDLSVSEGSEGDVKLVEGAWSPATGRSKKKLTCKGGKKVCGLPLSGTDCIRCDGCKHWFHPKCQELSVEAFAAISKYEFLWLCMDCKPDLMAILGAGKYLETRIADAERKIIESVNEAKCSSDFQRNIESRIEMIEKTFAEIKEQQTRVESSIQEQKAAVQEMPKVSQDLRKSFAEIKEQQIRVESSIQEQKVAVQEMPKVSQDLQSSAAQLKKFVESKEKEDRGANLILHNIPESKSVDIDVRKKYDTDSFYNVAAALLGDTSAVEVDQVIRLGKKGEVPNSNTDTEPKPRLMLIKLKRKECVDDLIKRRTKLKDVGFPNVYLTRDLSPEERAKHKSLRDELEQKGRSTHVIFRGRVVPRNLQV